MKDSELLKILDGAGKGNSAPVTPTPVQQVNYPSNIQSKWIDALAQLETQGGKKSIGDNNLFNIKDNSGKGKTAYDKVEGSRDAYMSYDSPEAAKQALLDLLKRKYPQAYNATTAEEFVAGLKGYATDPNHAKKLLSIINKPGMSDSVLLGILDKVGSANKIQQPETQTPVEQAKAETPKDESVWGKTKDFLLAGPFGMTKEINKASPEARTMVNESTKTLTAGLYNPQLATEEEIQKSPKAAMAGNMLGYTPYAVIPGGILTQAGISAAHGGVTTAAEGGTAGEVAGSAVLGGVLGGAGAVVGKGISAAVKGGRQLLSAAAEKLYPTQVSELFNKQWRDYKTLAPQYYKSMLDEGKISKESYESIKNLITSAKNPEEINSGIASIASKAASPMEQVNITQSVGKFTKDSFGKTDEILYQSNLLKNVKKELSDALSTGDYSVYRSKLNELYDNKLIPDDIFNKLKSEIASERNLNLPNRQTNVGEMPELPWLGKKYGDSTLKGEAAEAFSNAINKTIQSHGGGILNQTLPSLIGAGIGYGTSDYTGINPILSAAGGAVLGTFKMELAKALLKKSADTDIGAKIISALKNENVGNKKDFTNMLQVNVFRKTGNPITIEEAGKIYDQYHAGVKQFMESPWYKNAVGKGTQAATSSILVPTGQAVKSDIQERTQKNTSPYKLTGQ